MMTPSERQMVEQLKTKVDEILARDEGERRIYSQDIAPKAVKQQHIDGLIVFSGVEANLPDDGETQIKVYWATDTGKLYIWDGEDWLSTTLS